MINDIKTFGLWKTLKFAWQRAFRGYSDDFYWAHDEYLNYYFVPAIKIFCEDRLKECCDERFVLVYKTMLEKIDKWENASDEVHYPNKNSEMWSYFGNNILYFWD